MSKIIVAMAERICPTMMECATMDEAEHTAITLARYDQKEYVIMVLACRAVPDEGGVALRSVAGNKCYHESFDGTDGVKGGS